MSKPATPPPVATGTIMKTLQRMERFSQQHEEVLVSYSGGKDSLVTLDIAHKYFKKITCFFMYFVRGLEVAEAMLDLARQRYGVEILQYPHWATLIEYSQNGYRWPSQRLSALPDDISIHHVERLVMSDTHIPIILHGGKRSDSQWRRQQMNIDKKAGRNHRIYPLEDWNKHHVHSYLVRNNLPIPPSDGSAASGLGLTASCILWLYDAHRADYLKVKRIFPFVEAVVRRREFYGVGSWSGQAEYWPPQEHDLPPSDSLTPSSTANG